MMKNRNRRNVQYWVNNGDDLYAVARYCVNTTRNTGGTLNDAALLMLTSLIDDGITHTPDGVKFTKTTIRAAMRGM